MKSENTVTKISKWGNGYGIRVPVATLELYQLTEGSEVVLIKESDGVKISPHTKSLSEMTVAEIFEGVTPKMLKTDNAESLFGKAVGREIW